MANLHTKFDKIGINEANISLLNQKIRQVVETYSAEDYERILLEHEDRDIYLHFSPTRNSLYNWYSFGEQAEILEIGAAFGAITGLLCDKGKNVTVTEKSLHRAQTIELRYKNKNNLDIYVGDIIDIVFNKKFDFILLNGILEVAGNGSAESEPYQSYIKLLLKLLKPQGKILIAVDNRFGLKYFCGEKDPYTKTPFSGINNYVFGSRGHLFSKKELTNILENAGIEYYKFFYLLPDYKFPQLIYTDEYLPEKNLHERLITYTTSKDSLIAAEQTLYEDIIENNVFPFFCNSFLVECGKKDKMSKVVYAAVSSDRGRDNSFATVIYSNNLVTKLALYQEGYKNIGRLYSNLQMLRNANIPVIFHERTENSLIMPYIQDKTLSVYLRSLIKKDKNEYLNIFDRLYDLILNSSEVVEAESNAMLKKDDEILPWGPILKSAYVELIPLNCFWVNNDFLFFDQEFVENNYPAKYILFRAIHYMYEFAPFADAIVSKEFMKNRYNFTEKLWKRMLEEEKNFLSKIRCYNINSIFYRMSEVSFEKILKNAKMLQYKGEDFWEFKTTRNLQGAQNIQKELLAFVQEICKKNHLSYIMIYGTLLGAVRHSNMIPWDDDIDIALPRKDYEKLTFYLEEENQKYRLINSKNNSAFFRGGYSRVSKKNTTGIEEINWNMDMNHEIWIDIFPLDNFGGNTLKEHFKRKIICFYQRLLFAKVYGNKAKFMDMPLLIWKAYKYFGLFFSYNFLYKNFIKWCTRDNNKVLEYYTIYSQYTRGLKGNLFLKKDFNDYTMLPFGELTLPAPKNYDRYLREFYGKDYMRYPTFEMRKPHHSAIFDTNQSADYYINHFMHIFRGCKGKKLILWGEEKTIKAYLSKHGSRYSPKFIIFNQLEKHEKKFDGIEIVKAEEISSIGIKQVHVIVCSPLFYHIEKQLKQMGIESYSFFIENIQWITEKEW